jgi:hypothetical protein
MSDPRNNDFDYAVDVQHYVGKLYKGSATASTVAIVLLPDW